MLVCSSYVEPRGEAVAAMLAHEMPDEVGGVALAAMIGVGAEAADFRIPRKCQALASHGDEVVSGTYSVIRAHGAGSGAEEAGEGEVGEGDHFGCVGAGERDDFCYGGGWLDFLGQDHLEAFEGGFEVDAGDLGVAFAYDPDGFAGCEERAELLHRGWAG